MALRLFLVVSLAIFALTTVCTYNQNRSCKPGRPFMRKCNICWCASDGTPGGCTNYKCPDDVAAVASSSALSDSRIVGGKKVQPGEIPYQALMVSDYSSICGASLISKSAVLSAAHCVEDFHTFQVTLGTIKLYSFDWEDNLVRIYSREGVVHPSYSSVSLKHDVAVVLLKPEVALSSYIQLVDLPSYSIANETFADYKATASGWGRTADKSAVLSDSWNKIARSSSSSKESAEEEGYLVDGTSAYLQKVTLDIISNEKCWKYYGRMSVTSSILCAQGDKNRSTCNGDSGGPLTVDHNGGHILVGVVSFGSVRGCEQGIPVAFTRVTSYLTWIESAAGMKINSTQ
ncbi:brachyurin-like [Schistocerca cancellata]|uniref:brachyurin-like n=1 Tax=Schistocerca cancellata TaxID=274614 RepID=UPI002119443F|nr:brachyurin-like [Schistocerca cancellata]